MAVRYPTPSTIPQKRQLLVWVDRELIVSPAARLARQTRKMESSATFIFSSNTSSIETKLEI